MTDRYVRSTDGNDSDTGATWALAKATLVGVAAIDTAGDRLFVSQVHAETQAGAMAMNFAGTLAAPTYLIGGNDAAEPPTAVSNAWSATVTGNAAMTFGGVCLYVYGGIFTSGGTIVFGTSGMYQEYEKCDFILTNVGSAGQLIVAGASAKVAIKFKDCRFKFGNSGNSFQATHATIISGGSVISGSAAIGTFIRPGGADGRGGYVLIENFDFSNLGSTLQIFGPGSQGNGTGKCIVRNCKLPASWTGTPGSNAGPDNYGFDVLMENCDSGDTNYRYWSQNAAGEVKSETTIIKSGGASDGTTPLSWKMISFANAEYPIIAVYTPERAIWNEAVGASMTLTVEIVHDSATPLTDGDIWVEVNYPGNGSFPLYSRITDAKADFLATAADQASSSVTWATTGLSTPLKQKCVVTFTPLEKGVITWQVRLAKASYTVYVDAKATLT